MHVALSINIMFTAIQIVIFSVFDDFAVCEEL